MKRRIDKNKVYAFVGQAVTYLTLYIIAQIILYNLAMYILDNCITILR